MSLNTAPGFWIDMLKILDVISIEMQSKEADVDVVEIGIDALIGDVRTNQNIGGGKPLRNSWRIKTPDGIVLKLTVEAEVTTVDYEVSD